MDEAHVVGVVRAVAPAIQLELRHRLRKVRQVFNNG